MTSRALHLYSLFAAASTLLLITVGGLVTSHGAGMAVPDWPNTYGYNMFFFPVSQWVGGIFYEHTHRLIASGVGLLTGILALWLHGRNSRRFLRWLCFLLLLAGLALLLGSPARRADALVVSWAGAVGLVLSFFWPRCEPAPRWLRRLGTVAFLAVVLQGVLGGLRVVLLQDELGILHAALAQLFLVLICALALFTSPKWKAAAPAIPAGGDAVLPSSARGLVWVGTALIFAQLLLGAAMRHQHAGLAIPDFPLAYGAAWPAMDEESVARYNRQRIEVTAVNPITAFQIGLQMAHRITALGIMATVGVAACTIRKRLGGGHPVTRLSVLWAGLILAQAVLGAATIWSNKAADVATAHVMGGALSLVCGAMLCIVAGRASSIPRRVAGEASRPESNPAMLASPVPAGGSS